MNKTLLVTAALLSLSCLAGFAQKKNANQNKEPEIIFQEATAREAHPNVAVFVFPQICDLEMIKTIRTDYGPYEFAMPVDIDHMRNEDLMNVQTRALQRACQTEDADLIIEPIYTSTIYDVNNNVVYVSLSGYPAKYVNFRSLKPEDMKMIQILYPNGVESLQRQNSSTVMTSGVEEGKK